MLLRPFSSVSDPLAPLVRADADGDGSGAASGGHEESERE